ncbi:CIA30 family protein [Fertoebacter nigrum]|uniref:CIA30 family protein n=2 Tax=Fertoeibacter niger TaxID=2656921 RepID=A0A8X8H4V9_9RHOB|nr:CIA30 family protein [Fertoeibacter niger]
MVTMPALGGAGPLLADEAMIEDFQIQPETRWRFFADTVMGGVSCGQVTFLRDVDGAFARMTGRVSTENNGGFIQMQMELRESPPEGTTGVRLIVRGNDQPYFVHLRTRGTILPWQYYQAGFDVTNGWAEVRLPFAAFAPSGVMLRDVLRESSLRSVAVVAFGRNHAAKIDVREVGFY